MSRAISIHLLQQHNLLHGPIINLPEKPCSVTADEIKAHQDATAISQPRPYQLYPFYIMAY